MEAVIYNQKGKETGKTKLPEAIFASKWNADLVQQVAISMQANARTSTAHTKDRSAVRGGGKKPWRQKGTGRARHGSTRSPIWVGGGVTHGPKANENYTKKLNKKMKSRALYAVLSKKFAEGEVMFVDSLSFDAPKSKGAREVLSALSSIKGFETIFTKKKNASLIVIPENNIFVKKSFNNFGNVEVEEVRNLNVLDVLTHKYLIIVNPEVSVKDMEGKIAVKK